MSFLFLALNILASPVQMTAHCTEPIRVSGAGSSFPTQVYDYAATAYELRRLEHGRVVTITYRSVNSAYGKSKIVNQNGGPPIVFAGSESLLAEDIREMHPTIRTVPIMAGALAIVYNLPNVSDLRISVTDLPNIYMGNIRYWDHVNITSLNPNVTLPHVLIAPVARSDAGGDTEIFTSAMSSFSSEWNASYGIFITPRFKAGQCCDDSLTWPPDVIKLYGNQVLGMMGLVSSIPYTIGYAAQGNVENTSLKRAKLINSVGNLVEPTYESVQAAIDYFAKLHPRENYFRINNALSSEAYPMASFSYIIFNETTSPGISCCAAQEFIGFVETVVGQPDRTYARLGLVGLTEIVKNEIVTPELKKIQCEGELQYGHYLASTIMPEATKMSTVILACAAVFLLFLGTIAGFLMHQQQSARQNAMNVWNLPPSAFSVTEGQASQTTLNACWRSRRSLASDVPIMFYKKDPVMLEEVPFETPDRLKETTRDTVWLARRIGGDNLLRLVGLTIFGDRVHMVYDYPSRGSIRNVLQTTKLAIPPMVRLGFVSDLMHGVEFLHRNNVVHGRLNPLTVFFDVDWTIKIGYWAGLMVAFSESTESYRAMTNVRLEDESIENVIRLAYLDPVAMRGEVDSLSDVYSAGLLAVYILTNRMPYVDEMEAAVLQRLLRSKLSSSSAPMPNMEDIDHPVKSLIKKCFGPHDSIPESKQLTRYFDKVNPCKKGVVGAMMETIEDHMQMLEAMVAQVTNRMKEMIHGAVPSHIAVKLVRNEAVEPEYYESCSVCFSDVVGFTEICSLSTPFQIVACLNELWRHFDKSVGQFDACRVDTYGDAYMACSGLPVRNGHDHIREICLFSQRLRTVALGFCIDHLPKYELRVRVGMSSGPVTAGIVGFKTPKYCVFGDTVKAASRMESTSEPMRIQLSHSAQAMLSTHFPDEFKTERREATETTGKRAERTYWLLTDLHYSQKKN